MDRKLPSFNQYLTKKWQAKNLESHIKRMKEIKPRITNFNANSGKYLSHLGNHSKKIYNNNALYSSIDHENIRMLHILSGRNYKGITPIPCQKPNFLKPSLNFDYRKRMLSKFDNENKSIMKRLENLTPVMPRKNYIEHWIQNDNYLKNISHKFSLRPLLTMNSQQAHRTPLISNRFIEESSNKSNQEIDKINE